MDEDTGFCFTKCNEFYKTALDPKRTFCKKGCRSDFDLEECREKTCAKLCIKEELGTDESKWGKWSKVFSRAPADSADCLDACYTGCMNKIPSNENK